MQNIKDENFETFLKFACKNLNENNLKDFEKIQCDLEKIEFVYKLNSDKFFKLFDKFNANQKNDQHAFFMKNKGNEYFQVKNFQKAIEFYNSGILSVSSNNNELKSLLFANRSAVLFQMKNYKHVLNDINYVLELNAYNEKLIRKLFWRKAYCHYNLNELDLAVDSFEKFLKCIEFDNNCTQLKNQVENDLKELLNKKKTFIQDNCVVDDTNIEIDCKQKNKLYPSCHKSVEISFSQIMGRHAKANTFIDIGKTIVVEQAYCSFLHVSKWLTHCQLCLKRVTDFYACDNCTNVVYCSNICKKTASKSFHHYECNFLTILRDVDISIICFMAFRLITQKSLKYFLNIKNHLNKPLNVNQKKTYNNYDYEKIFKLITHSDKRTYLQYFQYTNVSVFLLCCLKKINFFSNDIKLECLSENEKFIGNLLLTNLQVLQFNAHEIFELNFSNTNNMHGKSEFVGGGLYPTLSLFNHSCDPGIIRFFQGTTVFVKTIKYIENGEMIAENYGPIYTEMPKNERLTLLRNQYWFDCSCKPCTENWPLFQDICYENNLKLKCKNSNCINTIVVDQNNDEFIIKCLLCNTPNSIIMAAKELKNLDSLMAHANQTLSEKNYKDALNEFITIYQILYKYLKPPFKDLIICQKNIRTCLLQFGNINLKI